MKVRMKKTVPGSVDGYTLNDFVEGTEHDLTHTPGARDLAQVFIREGWAEEVNAKAPVVPADVPVERLPPLEEFVAHGYLSENYTAFIKARSEEAIASGRMPVVRPPTPEELAAAKAEEQAAAELRKRAEDERAATDKAVEPAPAPTPPAAPEAPTTKPEKRKGK